MSSSKRSTIIVEQLRKQQMLEALSRGKRLDGRNFESYRNFEIEVGIIDKANGSAKVKLGNTEVLAGVKVETGEPFEGLENKGALIMSAEVLPTASSHVEPGPPDEEAIELSRVVDRGVRESKMLDLDKLALIPGKIVYTIFVDCSIINSDGNLLDATSYAVVAALLTCNLPVFEVQNDKVVDTGNIMPPPITTIPISVTAVKIGDSVLLDPTMEEEACMDARLTITSESDGNLVAAQKGYTGPFTINQILRSVEIARIKGEEIRSTIKGLNETG
ncbi:MAG: exosome complex protein Rrp42 [Nitrosopumilus sp.]|nr:exosome complex protein Rrp42 [Nitrosopumilus sp.]